MDQPSFDLQRYGQLLAEMKPLVIESEEDHDRMLAIAESLMEKGDTLSSEEERLLTLVVFLIESFERAVVEEEETEDDEEEDVPHEPPAPHLTLHRLMEARQLGLLDVADLFGNPRIAQEVLDGKREITRGQAKQLARFFQVPEKLFRG